MRQRVHIIKMRHRSVSKTPRVLIFGLLIVRPADVFTCKRQGGTASRHGGLGLSRQS
jgi:hypothetical protein